MVEVNGISNETKQKERKRKRRREKMVTKRFIVHVSHVKYRFYIHYDLCAFKPLRDVLLIVNLLF